MTNKHDPIRHLRYLRQSLSQDNEAIGFFISAGCPLAVTMPKDEWPLIPDVKNLTIAISAVLKVRKDYTCLLEELAKAGKDPENIEDILSFLRSLLAVSKGGDVRGLTEAELIAVEKAICSEIVEKLNVELPNTETPYHRLCNWVRSIDRKVAIELFTTNYDLLLEQALDDLEVPYFDGFVGSRKSFFDLRAVEENLIPVHWSRLWKIHGSINWHQDTNKAGERIVCRTSSPEAGKSHLIYPSHLKYEESRKMPYLALIDQLNRFIRQKSSFLILNGYSFNDGHLNDAIVNALKSNPTGMVLALQFGSYEKTKDEGGGERYPNAYRLAKRQHNLNVWTDDRAIIGTNVGDWKRAKSEDEDKDLLSFVTNVTLEGESGATVPNVKLGDFSEFTNFLKKFIGLDAGDQFEK